MSCGQLSKNSLNNIINNQSHFLNFLYNKDSKGVTVNKTGLPVIKH
jgi:hypothetical protein